MMNKQLIFGLLGVLTLFIHGFAQDAPLSSSNLFCYYCSPLNNPTLCNETFQSGVPQINCNEQFGDRPANTTLFCMSAFLKNANESLSGVYRGCYMQNPSVLDTCDLYKQETNDQNIFVQSCEACTETRCNNITFNDNGDTSRGSTSVYQLAFTFIVGSLLFSTLF